MAAIMSGCFVATANHRSLDGATWPDGSWIVSPEGEVLAETSAERPIASADIELAEADRTKLSYPRNLRLRGPYPRRARSSASRALSRGGVEERRGGLGPMGITPFPLPAHQTGRADFPHPASRPASPQSTRRGAKMDTTLSDHTELPEHDRIGETWCHATTPYGA